MTDENLPHPENPAGKIYKDKQIWTGSYLGGPLVAGYLLWTNFNVLGEKNKARKTWIITIIAAVIIFGVVLFAPFVDKIPSFVIPVIYTAAASALFQIYQEKQVTDYIKEGGKIHSWWKLIGVSLIGLLLTIVPIFAFAYLYDASVSTNTVSKTYGTPKHDVAFDKDNVTESEVDNLADGFRQTTFFDDKIKKSVDVKKIGSDYEIAVYCNETIKTNSEAVGYFRDLRDEMQKLFPNNKIIFNLVIGTSDNIVKRLE